MKKVVLLLSVLVCLCLMVPQAASAHATLLKADPAQGSQLEDSPQKVTLLFNERLGSHLYKLKVDNSKGKAVTDRKAALNKKQNQLSLKLPDLDDGVYTVTYKVISADSHPVSSSYTFTVGDQDKGSAATAGKGSDQGGHSHGLSSFMIRIAYYLSLLLVVGWTLWGVFIRRDAEVSRAYRQAHQWLKGIYLFFLLGFGFFEFSNIIPGLGSDKIIPLFFSSAVGLSWLISLVLALIAFVGLGKWKGFDGAWVVILLGAESFNGHAFAFDPTVLTLSFNLIHLLAASIWSGGLLYLLYFWKKHPAHSKRFLPVFSRTALICMVILVITGTVNTFLFVPAISDVFVTLWGRLLLVKVVLVLAVIVTAGLIRRKMKKGESIHSRVKIDFTLMVAIMVIVGVFTVQNPTPSNDPFVWKTDKNNVAMTTNITPKTPSPANTVTVHVDANKKPNNVILVLHDKSDEAIEPIQIPLKAAKGGKKGYTYKASGVAIPFSGNWQVEVQVLDPDDDLTLFKKEMRVYSSE